MKLIKSIMSAFAIVLATTACAGNGGENKKSNEPTKEDNKMEVVSLNKAEFLKKVYDFEANPNDWKFEGKRPAIVDFYATWCGPCKALHPVLEELSKEYSGKVDIYQIDVDQKGTGCRIRYPQYPHPVTDSDERRTENHARGFAQRPVEESNRRISFETE